MVALSWTTTTDWTVPAGVATINNCWAIGGGGNGAVGGAGIGTNGGTGGAGGGGGGASLKSNIPVTPGEVLSMQVTGVASHSGLLQSGSWRCLAYGGGTPTGGAGASGVGDSRYTGSDGGPGLTVPASVNGGNGGAGGVANGSPWGASGGGAGGLGGIGSTAVGGPGGNAVNYGAGGGGGGGGGRAVGGGAAGGGYPGLVYIDYDVLPAPTVTSCSPNTGPTAGGTAITVTGTNIIAPLTSVTIGGVAATSVVHTGTTTFTCVTPAHAAGAVNINLNAGGQAGSGTSVFTYVAAPTVTSCSPNTGSANGGTAVTITGTNLAGTTGVTFGGTAATSVVNVNSTTVTCVTPAHAHGAVNVVATNPYGSGTGTNAFTYISDTGFNMPNMGI